MSPPCAISPQLKGTAHGFFGRAGGVSAAPYDRLNGGPGSDDLPAAVQENRARVAKFLGADHLISAHQVHGAAAVFVDAPFSGSRPKADGLVTATPGLGLCVLAADCVPVLFYAPRAGLVGAAHAGWRGSLAGVLEATVKLMVAHGADRAEIRAGIGPCLRAPAFEVGDDLKDEVLAKHQTAAPFFEPREAPGKWTYDHIGFVRARLADAGLSPDRVDDTGGCTLTSPQTYFSYRHSRKTATPDYGRNMSAIALRG